MTNLEINEKIAELMDLAVDRDSKPHSSPNAIIIGNVGMMMYKEMNWAEHIEDAFELFEEMPPGTELLQEDEPGLWAVHLTTDEKTGVGVCVNSETAPLAICLAWIKWKESQTPSSK